MLGSGGVGKTAISLQFVRGEFSQNYIPTIEDEFNKNIVIDKETLQLEIIDTAGQEDFKDLRFRYIKECDGFAFVYSVEDPSSLGFVDDLYKECKTAKGTEPKCIVLGNKCDLPTKSVTLAQAKEKAKNWGNPPVFETSAKTNQNITEAFEAISRILLNKPAPVQEGCCQIE